MVPFNGQGYESDYSSFVVIVFSFSLLLGPLCYKLITIVNCYLETGLSCNVY